MNKLNLKIIPNDDSNDYQVLIDINGNSVINGFIGIDPDMFFKQKQLYEGGRIFIGRCGCGEVGCGNITSEVTMDDKYVYWEIKEKEKFCFLKEEYLKHIKLIEEDKSWEDVRRRIGRLVGEIFNNTVIENKYYFNWASCRFEDNKVFLSYSTDPNIDEYVQEMISIPWNGVDENDAIKNAIEFKKNNPEIKTLN